jgi:hypothetical protein
VSALLCAVAIAVVGCHGNPATSGYGILWVTVTDEPGDYTSYVITIDSVTLTRTDGAVVTAVATPEIVDFAQLSNMAEMWSSGAIPVGTYTSATITLDYTNAAIYVLVNGQAQKATVLDYTTNAAPTTYAVSVQFDPANPLVITPTYASTSAMPLAIDLDLAASGTVLLSSNPATVYTRPFLTAGVLSPNTRPIRVRGPLINSNTELQTYTVYIRPFYDEANNIGTLTLFSGPSTVYTINGNTYVGQAGLDALSVLSAGITITAGYTQFVPDFNSANSAYAGRFNLLYVIGASSLEDQYTEGISGDVIERDGNTLYLRGSTLVLNTANSYSYQPGQSQVLLGPATIVTADNNSILTGLNSNSVAVGQHITARGLYSRTSSGVAVIDSTGSSSTNTGSVRLQSTELWGPLVSSAAGSLVMNVQAINNWPIDGYNFAGNGPVTPNPAAFSVTTGSLAPPAGTVAPDPLWVDGFFTPFGAAPPDFTAVAVNNESSVQLAGTPVGGGMASPPGPGTETCGIGSQICTPASLQVVWRSTGTTAPFETSSASGFTINLANAALITALIRIGPESIDLKSLPASPMVVPTTAPVINIQDAVNAQSSPFSPLYAYGNPATATTTGTVTSSTLLNAYSSFSSFITALNGAVGASTPATQFEARGVFDRTNNTFSATSIDFVL